MRQVPHSGQAEPDYPQIQARCGILHYHGRKWHTCLDLKTYATRAVCQVMSNHRGDRWHVIRRVMSLAE